MTPWRRAIEFKLLPSTCTGGNGHRRGGSTETVPDAAIVLRSADQNADGFVVIVAAEHVVDEGDVEVEFAGVFGLELARLEFDDDVAR